MKFQVIHEIKGRVRIHLMRDKMTDEEADALQYVLNKREEIVSAKVNERTGNVVIYYDTDREKLFQVLQGISCRAPRIPELGAGPSERRTNREYRDKLIEKVVVRYGCKLLVPYPVRCALIAVKSVKYIWKGLRALMKRKIEVSILDGVVIAVSLIRGDRNTAGSVMFLLDVGELLETWTHKKSVDDLARSMALNDGRVWLLKDGREVLVPSKQVQAEELVVVHMGNVIPFDGVIACGEGMVNQASLTGESIPVSRRADGYVYAGTVLEDGELTIRVKETSGATKYEMIVSMIEKTQKLKSEMESRAEHLADRLVPYTLLGTGITYAITGNVTKALAVLMVDFSCALKLAMPITVLAAIREANKSHITVKGGKFLERMAEADTIVFDKTGTLTRAQPVVSKVVSLNNEEPDELLRLAACLEEHFPHSMAKAVVNAAWEKGLVHEENHSKVQYIVAHGISSEIEGQKVVLGSYHFIFEDEACVLCAEGEELLKTLPQDCSYLYLAIDKEVVAVLCINDPVREEAKDVISLLRNEGFTKIVMMTGDSHRAAEAAARKIGVDEYYYEVLPEDKAAFIEKEHREGRKVVMIGDGINDSPALSAADVGIAISDGAQIAREIADITIESENLLQLVELRMLSSELMKKIHENYVRIVGINSALILGGVTGMIQPATAALLHNISTIAISMKGMNGWNTKDGLPEALEYRLPVRGDNKGK